MYKTQITYKGKTVFVKDEIDSFTVYTFEELEKFQEDLHLLEGTDHWLLIKP